MVTSAALARFLKKHKRVGLDSNLLIYFIEGSLDFHKPARQIFESVEKGRNQGVCSTLTLLEVLVQPYRKGNDELVNQFYGLLTTFPNLTWADLSIEIADLGAQLRATYKLKTPDAIILATAIHSGATGFIGNDLGLKKVMDLETLALSD